MSLLANISNVIERLAGNAEAIIKDRENMLAEISSLREQLMERDKEAVKAAQAVKAELESVRTDASYFEQERVRIEAKLQGMNDRLIALIDDEKRCGG